MSASAVRLEARPETHVADADECLLTSKITPPGLPAWTVSRRRIEKLISEGMKGSLTVVTGPPGAGKTISLASWSVARTGPGPTAWISVDCYDNRPQIFWRYLAEALRRAGVAVPRPDPAELRRESADLPFLLRLASALAAQDPPVILVLDDIHLLTNRNLLDDFGYVLQHASAGLRLVIASRTDPPLPLHRFLLAGDLTEVRATDLAFTVPEAGLLLAQHGITLSSAALESLTSRAEGWPAGLRLAALAMRGHPDPDQFARDFGAEDSIIHNYLADEVLDAQPARIRDLLLKTSILNRVSDDLADELTGDRQAASMLPALAETNAFIQPLGHGWYRYHSMFAEVLRVKLRRESGHQLNELRSRAARWFRRNGRLADAVSQAAAADDWELAARTVIDELAVEPLIDPRRADPLADEIRRMPVDPASAPPAILAAAAIAVRDRRTDAGRSLLHAADSTLDHLPGNDEIPSRLAATQIRLALARQAGDLPLATAAVAEAERLLAAIPPGQLNGHPGARARVLAGRGVVELWNGRFDSAAASLDAGAASGAASDRADCMGHHALLEAVRGRFAHAAELASAVLPAAGCHAESPGSAAAAEVALAWVHLEHARLDESRRQLAQAQDSLRARPEKLITALAYLVAARHSVATGRPGPAAEMIDRARRGWSSPPWLAARLALAESHAHAAVGQTRAAIEDARRAQPTSRPEAAIALARAWLSAGNSETASRALRAVSQTHAGEAPDQIGVEACLVQAELQYRIGERETGRRALEQALKLAEPEQLVLPFTLERAWLEPILRSDSRLTHAFRRLFDLAGGASARGAPALGAPVRGTPGRAEPARDITGRLLVVPMEPPVVAELSQREREVLQRASAMLSTAEIAQELYLSVNTVKSHLQSCFRKLGASRRGEAVRRARQLQLLLLLAGERQTSCLGGRT